MRSKYDTDVIFSIFVSQVFYGIASSVTSMAEIVFDETAKKISDGQLSKMYELMVLTRTFDSQAVNLQRQGRIGFYVPCEGEEAALVGSAMAIQAEDWLFPDYRSSGVMITRGMALETILAQLMANSDDYSKGRSMPSHWGSRALKIVPPSSPLCTQLPHAVGVALGAKLRGEKICTIAYFGDGGTSSNDFHSGLNFAAVFKTPTVFFCRNNGYAISLPVAQQTATTTLAVKAVAYNMEGVRVDGNDVLAVYSATLAALEKARNGGGPTLIEAATYRLGAHSTSDDPTRYRDSEEVELMRTKDPILRFQRYIRQRGMWDEEYESNLRQTMLSKVKTAITNAESVPQPGVRSLFEDVYAELSPELRRQADVLAEEVGEA
jgi:pyruvate dehydrogenase E1 component alpha subunit